MDLIRRESALKEVFFCGLYCMNAVYAEVIDGFFRAVLDGVHDARIVGNFDNFKFFFVADSAFIGVFLGNGIDLTNGQRENWISTSSHLFPLPFRWQNRH